MNSTEARGAATILMWAGFLLFLWQSMSIIGAWTIPLAFVLMIPLMVGMGLIWRQQGDPPMSISVSASGSKDNQDDHAETEKRKRERIDNVLRDMSTEDLEALKQRLEDGLIDDDMLAGRIVGDDGEFLMRPNDSNRYD